MNTDKVLTYNPITNINEFLTYTERTVHTEHGKMYRITTKSGHSIKVTDDHSLATVGTDNVFSPLPPQDAIGKLVPIVFRLDYEANSTKDCTQMLVGLISAEELRVEDWMLTLPKGLLGAYLLCALDRVDWQYKPKDDHELNLFLLLLARAEFYHEIKDGVVVVDINNEGYIPEDGALVPRGEAAWTNIYRILPYTWSEVISVEEIEREEITYDFTVPEFPLFIGNLILVYDTMQVHVPVTEAARQEAFDKMLPSKNLFSVRNLEPTMLPQQESVFGMFQASTPSNAKPVNVTDIKKLRSDIEDDVIKPNHPVIYNGTRTTAGLVLANDLLPQEYRNYKDVWKKGVISKILSAIGRNKPDLYTKVADGIKELGAMYSYKMGASFKVSDFDLADLKKKRDAFFAQTESKIKELDKQKLPEDKKYEKKVQLLREAQSYAQKLTDDATNNAFHQWAYSGSRGSTSQVMQIISSPTIVQDPKDRVIPMLIRKSYNEGLSPADYWVSSYGTRKGTVGAKLSVAPGGALAKELIGNTLDIVVSTKDCGTKDGVEYPVTDKLDILGRYEAGSNRFIDGRRYEEIVKKGGTIKVRSPITCHAKHGVCQMCYGHTEKGKLPVIGDNVGVQAAQAITEPLTQMGLSSKHTAGTAAEETVGFDTMESFFTMTSQYAGAALISGVSGTVTRIEPAPAGGTDIYVGNKKYHAAPGRTIRVKIGDHVNAGDLLTNGLPNLKKIVPHKGIDAGRKIFVDHAYNLYNKAKAYTVRKNLETVARGMINYVRITNPGDFEYLEGDVVDYNALMGEIRENPTKRKPTFEPVQDGSTHAPRHKPDWLANFGFKYLEKNLIDNAARGVKSDIHSYHPVPAYAVAAEFGKGKDGRY